MPASVFMDAPPIDLDPDGKSKPLSLSAMCGHSQTTLLHYSTRVTRRRSESTSLDILPNMTAIAQFYACSFSILCCPGWCCFVCYALALHRLIRVNILFGVGRLWWFNYPGLLLHIDLYILSTEYWGLTLLCVVLCCVVLFRALPAELPW